MSDLVRLTVEGAVADVRLCSPGTGNAIDLELMGALRDRAQEVRDRDDVGAVLLSAEGRMFCAGGNLGWMAAQPDREDALRELASVLHEGLGELLDLDVPIVAAVHGPAAGAGVSLALVADIAYAGRSANFTVAYTAVGLSPDGGCSWLLPRAVGHRRASELMLTNRRVDADEAAAIGLVTAAVDDAELDATARATAQRLASGPTEAFAATKRLLRSTWTAELDEQLDREAACIAELAGSPTGTEGVDAFLAKRPPDFG